MWVAAKVVSKTSPLLVGGSSLPKLRSPRGWHRAQEPFRRPHSTYQKVVQGNLPPSFLHFIGAVGSNTLFSNTSALTNSLLFRANSTCKGSRTPRFVEHFWVPILGLLAQTNFLSALRGLPNPWNPKICHMEKSRAEKTNSETLQVAGWATKIRRKYLKNTKMD